jgi:hypothetical protein
MVNDTQQLHFIFIRVDFLVRLLAQVPLMGYSGALVNGGLEGYFWAGSKLSPLRQENEAS